MKRLAVDIVILPPDSIMDMVIEWNRILCKSRPANIVLNKTNYLPHISLAMGCLSENQLQRANTMLQAFATQHHSLELRVPAVKMVRTASTDSIITLDINLSPEIGALHESIVRAFRPLLTHNAVDSDLYDAPPINQSSLDWINQFIPHSSFEHFWPHITVGFGEQPASFRPYSFQASRLAICHLGNHCTCRNILGEVFLKT